MDKLQAFEVISRQIADGALVFPTSIDVALRLREMLSDPDCHIDRAVKLAQAEPFLAARIVAVANSVAYNPYGREVIDLRSAMSRLGFATVRSLTVALITKQMAGKPVFPAQKQIVDQLWNHTCHVAALARVLAKRVTHVDPEAALFAGIVHELSGFYLLSLIQDYPCLQEGDYSDWIEIGERQVGLALLPALGVPEDVRHAIGIYWDGYLSMPPKTLGDTLLLAEELSPVASPLHRVGDGSETNKLDAQIEVLIGEEQLTEILEESKAEVDSLSQALHF